ncbi:MAG TPA: hypothetical protein VIW24_15125 [Aldersonia sp.]
MDFDDVRDELYGLDPAEFVAARTAQVAAARATGDKALAGRIGKLRKPTVSAWVVNLLGREAPDEVGALLDLGAALQDAQRHLSGADLRALSGQRQKAVSALARRAGTLAADRGRPVDENLLREVGQTLNAALADPAVAAQVRSGTTVTAQTYDGFGPSGLAAVPDAAAAEPEPEPVPPPKPRRPSRADKLAAARTELDAATAAVTTAQESVEEARVEVARAREDIEEIDARIAELRDRLDAAEEQRQFARTTERATADGARRAERDLEHAERRAEKAQATVDDLQD